MRACVLFAGCAALLFGGLVSPFDLGARAAQAAETQTVSLTIDFGDGAQRHYPALPVAAGATVLQVLEAATQHAHGITFKYRGKGEAAMVTEIDGQKNEGASGKNWLYKVNDKWADRGCGVYPLEKGDAVLWTFGKEQ